MRKSIKRVSKRLLAVMLSVLMITLVVVPATAATSTPPGKNTASRSTNASALSSQATAYYSADIYNTFLDLADNQDNSGVDSYTAAQNNDLYDSLYNLMSTTHTHNVTYSGYTSNALATYWLTTDTSNKDTAENSYTFFYSDVPCENHTSMQREHIWPKSKASFYEHGGGSDLHHLRPAYSTVNTVKSNWGFGDLHNSDGTFKDGCTNTRTVEWPTGSTALWKGTANGETFIDVKDDVRGDIARILLYVYTRWQQPNLYSDVAAENLPAFDSDDSQDDGGKIIQSLDVLLDWMEQDPVSQWEMERNDLTEDIQGNRNVFIDYPELAWLMFDEEVPSDMDTPSGMAKTSSVPSSVTYKYVITADEAVSAYEGRINYPADKLSVNNIVFPDGQVNNRNGKILFNCSGTTDIDFSDGKAIITVQFDVLDAFNKSDVYGELEEFYNLRDVLGGNTPFDYENVFDDEVYSCGHTDLDNESNSYENTKYTIIYSYKENPAAEADSTTTKSAWSNLSNAQTIAELNMPYIQNPYYNNYTVSSAVKDGTTINAALGYQIKKYSVSLDGVNKGEYEYLQTATVTTDTEKDFFIDGNCVARGTAFSFYVTDNVDVTTDEPTGSIGESSSLIANALYVADAGAGKANIKMEMLVSATSSGFSRMGVAYAVTQRSADDVRSAIQTIVSGTAVNNKIAVHNSAVDNPNQSGQYQFIYAPYVSVSKVDKSKSLYFYAYVVDKNGNITISAPSQIKFANVFA